MAIRCFSSSCFLALVVVVGVSSVVIGIVVNGVFEVQGPGEILPLVTSHTRFIPVNGGEAFVLTPDGHSVLTGTIDGEIVEIDTTGERKGVWASGCGRPLALRFDSTGDLLVSDGRKGLIRIPHDTRKPEVICDVADGKRFQFADGLEIDQKTELIFLTEATDVWPEANSSRATVSAALRGRLIAYDPVQHLARTVMDGLCFPNGLELTHDGDSLLMAETCARKIWRIPLREEGPLRRVPFGGRHSIFVDNVRKTPQGTYLVAGSPFPDESKVLLLLPQSVSDKVAKTFPQEMFDVVTPAVVEEIDADGKVIRTYIQREVSVDDIAGTAEALVIGDVMWIGTYRGKAVARRPMMD